jgi:hypothetical protein
MSSKKTSSKKTKATKKKDKVENLQVADGKNDIEKIKNLEDLLGVKQTNPFGTTNKEVLEERMHEMTLTDLQTFAIKIGILPSGNKLSLKNKILRSFKSHAGAGSGYNIGYNQPIVDPSSKTAEEILKISKEGM